LTTGKTLPQFIEALGLDGVELMVYKTEPYAQSYNKETVGAHLNYWPYWLDFWRGNEKIIQKQFQCEKDCRLYFCGAHCGTEWLKVIKANIRAALVAEPEYLVWHVAEVGPREIFTFAFKYTDEEVVIRAAEVFNAVAKEIPPGVTVLFENLWWPGLRLTDAALVKEFFSLIKRDNVGIMLDTGHLMNTNEKLRTEEEGVDYICHKVKELGEGAKLIKGIHLNCSLSGKYVQGITHAAPQEINERNVMLHVSNIDQHRPFTTPRVWEIIDLIKPRYLVHELSYKNFMDFAEKIKMQLNALAAGKSKGEDNA